MLKFVTGNKNKFGEIRTILAPLAVEQLEMELDEIQELDPHKIIRHKLNQALKHYAGPLMVEDSSLYFDCFNGKLPGPFLKWFQDSLSNAALANITNKLGNNKARGLCIIGYAKNKDEIHFFESFLKGSIVEPRGQKDFGYGAIFQPEGQDKTFGEMARLEKHQISMRGQAAKKLKAFLLK
jgi:inosine triphosphate pyrophosphatase